MAFWDPGPLLEAVRRWHDFADPQGRENRKLLIKKADDKAKRLSLLEGLQASPLLSSHQRDWLRDEFMRTRRGMAGERDAAHYLDNYLKDDPDRAVLHDLRFLVDGDVVQIDHLVISRGMYVYLLETKNFNGNLHINEHGEFSVEYPGERIFGIPSPLEQSRRHEGPLRKLLGRLGITGRSGGDPIFKHCVLVNPKSVIHRPPKEKFDSTDVIKADQFRHWHQRFLDNQPVLGSVVRGLLNMRSAETVKEFGDKLARQHRPADPLALPDFMKPATATRGADSDRTSTPFAATGPMAAPVDAPVGKPQPGARRLICSACGEKISFAEGRFCWNNEARFNGQQYCRLHQRQFR